MHSGAMTEQRTLEPRLVRCRAVVSGDIYGNQPSVFFWCCNKSAKQMFIVKRKKKIKKQLHFGAVFESLFLVMYLRLPGDKSLPRLTLIFLLQTQNSHKLMRQNFSQTLYDTCALEVFSKLLNMWSCFSQTVCQIKSRFQELQCQLFLFFKEQAHIVSLCCESLVNYITMLVLL